jgi:hypothetical protein
VPVQHPQAYTGIPQAIFTLDKLPERAQFDQDCANVLHSPPACRITSSRQA